MYVVICLSMYLFVNKDSYSRYKYWPFEVLVEEKVNDPKEKDKKVTNTDIYQCHVDVSQLLFPGSK